MCIESLLKLHTILLILSYFFFNQCLFDLHLAFIVAHLDFCCIVAAPPTEWFCPISWQAELRPRCSRHQCCQLGWARYVAWVDPKPNYYKPKSDFFSLLISSSFDFLFPSLVLYSYPWWNCMPVPACSGAGHVVYLSGEVWHGVPFDPGVDFFPLVCY